VKRVLVIAGSDSSGGAGLQRDLAVLAHEPVRVASVVTAITAQSNAKVHGVHLVPQAMLAKQLGCALEEPVAAVKIGMLGTKLCVQTVATSLRALETTSVILDPVLAASSGRALLERDALDALRLELCPQVTLVTPNVSEAALLLDAPEARTETERAEQAQKLSEQFQTAVLLKGGHTTGKLVVDLLARPGSKIVGFASERIPTTMRGTGCALSSLIAARLANGSDLAGACKSSKDSVGALLKQQLW
jgi:hydroxymethylpyrimidine/phosphomethylpyrimidine kinase